MEQADWGFAIKKSVNHSTSRKNNNFSFIKTN